MVGNKDESCKGMMMVKIECLALSFYFVYSFISFINEKEPNQIKSTFSL